MRSRDIVRLESGMTVEVALSRLRHGGPNAVALVHRHEIGADAWYRLDAARLISKLSHAPSDQPLSTLVTLDALNRVAVTDLSEADDATVISGVLTIGSEVVGFQDQPERSPDRARRRGGVVAVEPGAGRGVETATWTEVGVDPLAPDAGDVPDEVEHMEVAPAEGRLQLGFGSPRQPLDLHYPRGELGGQCLMKMVPFGVGVEGVLVLDRVGDHHQDLEGGVPQGPAGGAAPLAVTEPPASSWTAQGSRPPGARR